MISVNVRTCKKCAFCKYWYDPTYSAIEPYRPNINMWKYEPNAMQMCLKRNIEMKASGVCGRYEGKVEVM